MKKNSNPSSPTALSDKGQDSSMIESKKLAGENDLDMKEEQVQDPMPQEAVEKTSQAEEPAVKQTLSKWIEGYGRQSLVYVACGVIGGLVAAATMMNLPSKSQEKSEEITVKEVSSEGQIQDIAKSPEEKLKDGISARLKQQTQELEQQAKENGTSIQQEADKLLKAEQEAKEKQAVENFQSKAKKVSPIQSVVNLPINGMKAILADDGTLMFVTDNGRYAFVGDMIDIWQQKPLETIDEIRNSVTTVPVKALGLKPDGLNVLQWGTGKERVSAFVDPQCGWCHALIEEVKKDKDLSERFTFDFYVVPALGDTSDSLARQLWCADATNEEKLNAFTKGGDAISALKQKQPGQCVMGGYDQTLVTAQMLEVKGVPFLIAADGRYVAGKPQSVRSFLIPPSSKKE